MIVSTFNEWIHIVIYWDDLLTAEEISDVETSWKEIKNGKAKTFTKVNTFLEDLQR